MMEARGGRPLLLIDIAVPRDIDPRCARARGRHAARHRRPAVGRRRTTSRAAPPTCPRPRRSSRRRSCASRAGSAQLDVRPTIAALRERGDEIVERVLDGERRALGVRLAARPGARRGARARRRWRACCTSRRSACRASTPSAATAAIELLRDLFALRDDDRRAAGEAGRRRADNVRELRRSAAVSARGRGALRLGTRGSPLALRQAALVAAGDRGRRSRRSCCAPAATAARAATSAAGSTRSRRRCSTARSTSPCTPPRTCPASSPTGSSSSARRRARTRATRSAARASLAALRAGRARRHEQPAARARSCGRCATISTSCALHGNLDTRLRRLARGRLRRDRARRRGPAAARARRAGRALDELVPAPGQGTLAIEARAGDARVARGDRAAARRRGRARAGRRARARDARSAPAATRRVGALARGAATARLELRAFVGAPDGGHWIRDARERRGSASRSARRSRERLLARRRRERCSR